MSHEHRCKARVQDGAKQCLKYHKDDSIFCSTHAELWKRRGFSERQFPLQLRISMSAIAKVMTSLQTCEDAMVDCPPYMQQTYTGLVKRHNSLLTNENEHTNVEKDLSALLEAVQAAERQRLKDVDDVKRQLGDMRSSIQTYYERATQQREALSNAVAQNMRSFLHALGDRNAQSSGDLDVTDAVANSAIAGMRQQIKLLKEQAGKGEETARAQDLGENVQNLERLTAENQKLNSTLQALQGQVKVCKKDLRAARTQRNAGDNGEEMKEQIASLKKEKNDTLRNYQFMKEKLAENNERYNSELETVRARVSELDTSNNELKQALREKEIEYKNAVAEQRKTRTALQTCVDVSVKGVKDTAAEKLRESLNEKDAEVVRLRREMEDLQADMTQKDTELSNCNTRAEKQNRDLRKVHTDLRKVRGELKAAEAAKAEVAPFLLDTILDSVNDCARKIEILNRIEDEEIRNRAVKLSTKVCEYNQIAIKLQQREEKRLEEERKARDSRVEEERVLKMQMEAEAESNRQMQRNTEKLRARMRVEREQVAKRRAEAAEEEKARNRQLEKLQQKQNAAARQAEALRAAQAAIRTRPAEFSKDQLDVIANNAKRRAGTVVPVLRMICSQEPSENISMGVMEDGRVGVAVVGNKARTVELKRKKVNLYVFNENDHNCNTSRIQERSKKFYDETIGRNIGDALQPITIVAYGQSGSGKTTTVNYVMDQIFAKMGDRIQRAKVSFVDIYKGGVVDLMQYWNEDKRNRLDRNRVQDIVQRRKLRDIIRPLLLSYRVVRGNETKNYSQLAEAVKGGTFASEAVRTTSKQVNSVLNDTTQTLRDVIVDVFVKHTDQQDHNILYGVNDRAMLAVKGVGEIKPQKVDSINTYRQMFKYAKRIRPVVITPQNAGGSSRSHFVIHFRFPENLTLSVVDLAGSEDYSQLTPIAYGNKMKDVGVMISNAQERSAALTRLRDESTAINESLQYLISYMRHLNSDTIRRIGGNPEPPSDEYEGGSISATENSEKPKVLARVLRDLGVLGHKGLTTMIATFKSDDDSESVAEAFRTVETLKDLIPSDEVLKQLKEAHDEKEDGSESNSSSVVNEPDAGSSQANRGFLGKAGELASGVLSRIWGTKPDANDEGSNSTTSTNLDDDQSDDSDSSNDSTNISGVTLIEDANENREMKVASSPRSVRKKAYEILFKPDIVEILKERGIDAKEREPKDVLVAKALNNHIDDGRLRAALQKKVEERKGVKDEQAREAESPEPPPSLPKTRARTRRDNNTSPSPPPTGTTSKYNVFTIPELKEMLRDRNVDFEAKDKKGRLLHLIEAHPKVSDADAIKDKQKQKMQKKTKPKSPEPPPSSRKTRAQTRGDKKTSPSPPPTDTTSKYDVFTIPELKDMLRDRNVDFEAKDKKGRLLHLIEAHPKVSDADAIKDKEDKPKQKKTKPKRKGKAQERSRSPSRARPNTRSQRRR